MECISRLPRALRVRALRLRASMLAAPIFSLAGVLRSVRLLRRRRRNRSAVACLVMCGFVIIEFIALFAYMSSVRL